MYKRFIVSYSTCKFINLIGGLFNFTFTYLVIHKDLFQLFVQYLPHRADIKFSSAQQLR